MFTDRLTWFLFLPARNWKEGRAQIWKVLAVVLSSGNSFIRNLLLKGKKMYLKLSFAAFAVLIITIYSFEAFAQSSPVIVDPDTGEFLGALNNNPYDPNSIANPYGKYGSPYSPNSVNNPYGQYGSPYSPNSITNPYGNSGNTHSTNSLTDIYRLYNNDDDDGG